MNGVLVVDKPSGPTSHDVVSRVRRALGTRRVGHTGTLDPLATGVLPLVIGQATRLAQFLSSDDKEYLADVRFGVATATYDTDGDPGDPPGEGVQVDLSGLERSLSEFRGTYLQTPPAYSAKKVGGRPAYKLARAGKPPDLAAVEVTVTTLEVVERTERSARLRIACSSGFYVRTLAHELGQRLGCGGHLTALRRIRAGSFVIDDAVPLDDVEREGALAGGRLVPLERLLPALPSAVLTTQGAGRARHGGRLTGADLAAEDVSSGPRVRLLDEAGQLVGIAEREPGGVLHPVIVLV